MAKEGMDISSVKSLLKQQAGGRGWTLCIGSGISYPAFPLWKDLVINLLSRCVNVGEDFKREKNAAEDMLKLFSPDSVIAAAFERHSLEVNDLSRCLYAGIMEWLGKDWVDFAKILADPMPGGWPSVNWKKFEDRIEERWPDLTSTQIARVISKVAVKESGPQAIISFNAEPLLYSQLNYFTREVSDNRKSIFDLVVRATTNRYSRRIPFYCLHGLLPIPELTPKQNRRVSIDKLVFSESEYLGLANANYSWQSNVFMSAASSTSMVFVGLSMTDPNIRKWLSWVHDLRKKEISLVNNHNKKCPNEITSHYWINKRPSDRETEKWIEAIVAHLGVRLVWIDEWSEVGMVLQAML